MDPVKKVGTTTSRRSRSGAPSLPLAALRNEAHRLIKSSLAVNTMDSYAVGVRRLESFRSQYGFDQCWPPSIETLSLFIASLSLQGLAFKTAKSYLSAIAFQCKLKSVEDVTKHFVIKKLLDGMERTGSKKMVRLPITISMLNSIVPKLSAVCINSYESLLFVAAFTLAFFWFFSALVNLPLRSLSTLTK